jgi:hypothetical protein
MNDLLSTGPAVSIPTKHAGVVFRSRLEARWAVFFGAVGIRWFYEYEGFQLKYSGWYLPDFWLPDLNTWIEIKPVTPTEQEAEKCSELAIATGHRAILLSGEVGWWLHDLYTPRGCGLAFFANGGGDMPYAPCVCITCGKAGIEFDGRSARICKHDESDKNYSSNHERVVRAVEYATRYQFHREG